MQQIWYYLFLIIVYPLSFLPLGVLYVYSDLLYFFLFHVIGYRKKVVAQNLSNAFPDRSATDRQKIMLQFYRYLCDLIVENIKLLSISQSQVAKRVHFKNPELVQQWYDQNKSVLAVVGHYANWELGGLGLSLFVRHKILAIYKPLSNPYFDQLLNRMRSKFGSVLVPMEKIGRKLIEHKAELTMTMLIADQTPASPQKALWIPFLNQDTPVFLGTEKLARRLDQPVVFCHMERERRGYYSVAFIPLFESPANTEEGEVTRKHTAVLEKIINDRPELWLWSHRRWKHQRTTSK